MVRGYDDFGRVLAGVNRVLEELDTQLAGSLAVWAGPARDAYEHAHRIWRAAAGDMAGQLGQLRDAIGVAHRNYGAAETANLAMWGHR